METIKIFLSSDNNYAPFVATTIASICDNTKSFCDFYVLDGGITQENQEKICKLKEQFNNFSIEFIKIDYDKFLKNFEYKNKSTHVSISTYNRFFIEQLKPNINRVIYLDVDIIALGDIKELWIQDLKNKTVGIIKDEGENDFITKYKEQFSLNYYFNAGVLLIDLDKWKASGYSEKAFEFEKQNHEYLNFADQDIINAIIKDDCEILDSKFNSQLVSDKNTVIRHFVNVYKPWKYNYFKIGNQIKPLTNFNDFWKYAQMTDFYNELKCDYQKNINSNMLVKRLSIIADKMKGDENK